MINEPHPPHHHPHPPPDDDDHDIERPPKSFLPIMLTVLVVYLAFNYNPYDHSPTRNPNIAFTDIKIWNYTLSSSSSHTTYLIDFHIIMHAAIANPARATFYYPATSAQLFDRRRRYVHSLPIPGGQVAATATWPMIITMWFESYPVLVEDHIPVTWQTIEFETKIDITGRVNGRHVQSVAVCVVSIALSDGSVLFIRC